MAKELLTTNTLDELYEQIEGIITKKRIIKKINREVWE